MQYLDVEVAADTRQSGQRHVDQCIIALAWGRAAWRGSGPSGPTVQYKDYKWRRKRDEVECALD